ncbi:hypothetical protein [Paraburkholderia kururiensis]|uniref:hypothetical protein n=1 Tax=Paraburkholderia kururiensis TaxID=984307 RepID=UPI0005A9945B|nr:hypothetical protein [Paraburkholderia kururiensis]
MKTDHLIAFFVLMYAWDRYNRSHDSVSAIDRATNTELAQFAAFNGTNFTNSLWDTASGQPAYQFGTINVPGGDSVMGEPTYTGIFGHM